MECSKCQQLYQHCLHNFLVGSVIVESSATLNDISIIGATNPSQTPLIWQNFYTTDNFASFQPLTGEDADMYIGEVQVTGDRFVMTGGVPGIIGYSLTGN